MTSTFSASPWEIVASAWRHRGLLRQMVYREVLGRYRGSVLGIAWSLFNPIFMLLIYTFVFSVIFKSSWRSTSEGHADFAITLFAGMIVFGLFSECINRAPGLVLNNPNYVKKVLFPLEILPWISLGSGLFHAAISVAILVIFLWLLNHTIPSTALYLPIVLLPLVLLVLGLCWFLAALGVYLRDISQTVGILTTGLMFISPVFYSTEALPSDLQQYISLNPLAFIIEGTRNVLIFGKPPNFWQMTQHFFTSALIAILGFAWFQKTRKGFADVL